MKTTHDQACITCERPLPKRAFRKQCASCIKEDAGYVRGPIQHVNRRGQTLWIDEWCKADESLGARS